MRYFVTFSLLLFLAAAGGAQDLYLRDVPQNHYAYDYVNDLISRGVTNGYPDGTYRGKLLMSRYEIASFISMLAKSFRLRDGKREKLLAEFQNETALLQHEQEKSRQALSVGGNFGGRWRAAQGEGEADYRLQTALRANFHELADLKINLDTMDSGFNGATRDLSRELLDFTGRVKLGRALLTATAGPGDVVHQDSGLFPAENGQIYRRPRRTIALNGSLARTDLALAYLARSADPSGSISVGETSASLTQNFQNFSLTLNPRLFTTDSGSREYRFELSGELKPNDFFRSRFLVGLAQNVDYPHGLYLRGEASWGDIFKLIAQRIGSRYRQQFTYSIFDIYDRNLADGTTNAGLEIKVPLAEEWFGKLKGDYTDPGGVWTGELHLGKKVYGSTNLEAYYQVYRGAVQAQALGLTASLDF
ncbi:MAG TPA: S-layer homology domain-containing protein [Candidatus Sulfotelmatobacter sp.]|nr:S-layer homology domain-containing protein [Candidatus Sulfotelmatobacter sp.]